MTRKVLVVDDSLTVRDTVAAALAGSGFEVIGAKDGVDGLEKLSKHDDVVLVFCDVNMPRMNGLDMIAEVKRTPKYESLPIVVLTTEGRPEMVRRAQQVGAKAWIVKPFKPDHLVAVLQKLAT
jgi:two-component system chemotaxis response regulator CheY